MSVPHPYNKTPEQGWSAMRVILDREMPERRKRRAIFWIWPLAVAAGLALALWFRLAGPESGTAQPDLPGMASEIAPANSEPLSQDNASVPQQIGSDSEAREEAVDSGNPVLGSSANISSPEHKDQRVQLENEETTHNLSIQKSTAEYTELAQYAGNEEQSALDAETDIPESSVVLNETPGDRSVMTTDMISMAGPTRIMDSEGPSSPSTEGMAFSRQRYAKTITPYLSLGGLVGTAQGTGTALAAGAGLRLNRWLSATTGLGYQWMNTQRSFLGGAGANEDFSGAGSPLIEMDNLGTSGGGIVIPEGNLVSAVAASDLAPIVGHVNQWQWQIGLEGHLSSRWRVEAGYQLGWGTRVTTQYPIVTTSGLPLETLSGRNSLLNDYDLVRSTTSAMYGGIAFAPARWLEVFGRYSYGFNHYLNVPDASQGFGTSGTREDKLSSIQVGLRALLRT